jgi:hypothetical protein
LALPLRLSSGLGVDSQQQAQGLMLGCQGLVIASVSLDSATDGGIQATSSLLDSLPDPPHLGLDV